jgi:hypothetical protein
MTLILLREILAEIRACRAANLPALWAKHLSDPCPPHAVICRQTLAWRLQAKMQGGLSVQTRRRIQDLMRAFDRDPEYRPPGVAPLKPGTEFLRHWKGAVHRVRVTNHGYEYEGEIYGSLSIIARRITGTQWSGPDFFGMRRKSKQDTA